MIADQETFERTRGLYVNMTEWRNEGTVKPGRVRSGSGGRWTLLPEGPKNPAPAIATCFFGPAPARSADGRSRARSR
ncbi:hypothetical protein [Streptomyces sp. NPDC014676]|uniref:hypothetical protein n=1 Tax=Streptomyces sp. NPDC014676 TaxID=3364879 RepID=UPI0036FAD0E9